MKKHLLLRLLKAYEENTSNQQESHPSLEIQPQIQEIQISPCLKPYHLLPIQSPPVLILYKKLRTACLWNHRDTLDLHLVHRSRVLKSSTPTLTKMKFCEMS